MPAFSTKKKPAGKPKKEEKEPIEVVCDPDMVARVMELLTQPCIAIYYCLAAYYTFGYAADASQRSHVVNFCIIRCLPILYLIAYVIYSKSFKCGQHCFFCKYILLGLSLSCAAEFLLQYDPEYFMQVVCIYSAVLLFYNGGLYYKYKGSSLSWLIIPLDILMMAAMYVFVTGFLSSIVFFGYGVFTMAMSFLAVSRFEKERTAPAYLGASGTFLLQLSHALYALSEFSPTFVCIVSPELVMMTYYLAQLGIGLSAHYC